MPVLLSKVIMAMMHTATGVLTLYCRCRASKNVNLCARGERECSAIRAQGEWYARSVGGLWGGRIYLPALKPRLDYSSVSHHAPDREVQAKARHGEDGEYPSCTGLHPFLQIMTQAENIVCLCPTNLVVPISFAGDPIGTLASQSMYSDKQKRYCGAGTGGRSIDNVAQYRKGQEWMQGSQIAFVGPDWKKVRCNTTHTTSHSASLSRRTQNSLFAGCSSDCFHL
ncbi:hypothetical protein HOY80DRAFT_1002432 [Tuber brumale]|nr:hypothetical protein HOY80DRAFT_1002432 [Tuber brumale]